MFHCICYYSQLQLCKWFIRLSGGRVKGQCSQITYSLVACEDYIVFEGGRGMAGGGRHSMHAPLQCLECGVLSMLLLHSSRRQYCCISCRSYTMWLDYCNAIVRCRSPASHCAANGGMRGPSFIIIIIIIIRSASVAVMRLSSRQPGQLSLKHQRNNKSHHHYSVIAHTRTQDM